MLELIVSLMYIFITKHASPLSLYSFFSLHRWAVYCSQWTRAANVPDFAGEAGFRVKACSGREKRTTNPHNNTAKPSGTAANGAKVQGIPEISHWMALLMFNREECESLLWQCFSWIYNWLLIHDLNHICRVVDIDLQSFNGLRKRLKRKKNGCAHP